MNNIAILPITPDAVPELGAVMARAFEQDPVWSYMFPDARRRPDQLRWFFTLWIPLVAELGAAFMTADRRALALWIPPGQEDRLSPGRQAQRVLRALAHLGPGWAWRSFQVALDAAKRQAEEVREPHWILDAIGVDPRVQRQGHGAALIYHVLDCAEAGRTPVYVQTHNRVNIPYYERFGFDLIKADRTRPGLDVWTCSLRRPPHPL
ncbi:MAG: GNAT family N-acetyltransferase [Candidatus Hydrogenedentes bacterium]|nr:GNAT family N-acetyltransferase [Candidatus Hydrogenedentota bacterium]